MPLTAGARLGPHEILGPLGAGGMGEVYLALDTRLDRKVALKVLPSRMSHESEAIGRFRREAFTLASLNHPNIATIYGFEEMPDGTTVLVMELVDGETLSSRLGRGAISVEEALQICAQISEALEVAHEHGVIHRDVKPGNVMLGPRGLVKVLDFGLARRTAGIEKLGALPTGVVHHAPHAPPPPPSDATMGPLHVPNAPPMILDAPDATTIAIDRGAADAAEAAQTIAMPRPSAGDDAATIAMPRPPAGDDAATIAMPRPSAGADAATIAMPPAMPADDAATLAMGVPPSGAAPRGLSRADTDSVDGMTVGTPGYMSPEQVLAEETDGRTDVFAVGSVLYECLSGRRAFTGRTVLETMRATLTEAPDYAVLPDHVPARIRALLARCLEKEPAQRPADMRAVRIELEEALGIRRAAALREGAVYATPHNLPAQATSFVGRESVLLECEQLLGQSRLLMLLGMGGSGKTRLALRLAETQFERFPDGVWFVNLASVNDSGRVADVAAAALGVPEEPGRTPLEALVHHVRDRRMLFVIDNCEDVLDGARSLIAGLLAGCSGARIVATSREALGVEGEHLFAVPTLATPPTTSVRDLTAVRASEAVHLFVDRARGAQSDFELTAANAADVVEICRRLDGIPLALELAAARVRMLGVAQIRARLGDRFKLLARSGGAGPSRQQTVLATIQWSWDHLLPPEQDLMRRLAVFTGGWTLERAAAVVSDSGDEFEVLDLLTRLVERSLVVVQRQEPAAPRYRFLESVWRFALEKLETHLDHQAMRERHLDTYLALGESAAKAMTGPRLAEQLAELKPEEENILAALTWCDQAPDGARRGMVLAESMNRFWSVLGRFALGGRVMNEALARDAANPPSAERARSQTRAAGYALHGGDHERARTFLEASLAYWRTSEHKSGMPAALAGLGVVAMYQSRFEDALALGEESLALYQERRQTRGVAMSLHNLGSIEWALARSDFGRARLEEALALLREVGDHSTEALCLSALASSLIRLGELEAARARLIECLDELAKIDAPREGVEAVEIAAELLVQRGRASDAARLLGAAEAARAAVGVTRFPAQEREIATLLQRLELDLGQVETARTLADGRAVSLEDALAACRTLLESLRP